MSTEYLHPLPDKNRCAVCGTLEFELQAKDMKLQRCARCKAVSYCSAACQKADWPTHKTLCPKYAMSKRLNDTGLYLDPKKAPKGKKGEVKRTRADIFADLSAFAQTHNGDTLTVSAWNLLDLTNHFTRADTHFLALTLRRNPDSFNPRTYYTLVDAEVLPWPLLEAAYAYRVGIDLEKGAVGRLVTESPRKLFEEDMARRKREREEAGEGVLGNIMVVSIEVPEGENMKPREALTKLVVHIMQPLGLFKEHQNTISRLPRLPRETYIKCLENSLRGGAYAVRFTPYSPLG